MPCTPSSAPFTDLVQPTSTVGTTTQASGFDPGMAFFLGQCCGLTYAQFDIGAATAPGFAQFELAGSLAGYSLSGPDAVVTYMPFTVSDADEPGPTAADAGDYYTVQGGFGVVLKFTRDEQTLTRAVIALRGTRTWTEWIDDAEALPVAFPGGLGSVHSGFYADYTVGTNGQKASPGDELSDRQTGSLAAQVATFVQTLSGADLYVTGHSLGGALATLCAADIATNFRDNYSSLTLYALASPRVAVGLSIPGYTGVPDLDGQAQFVMNFQQKVPNTYQIVHAADIVPILPPLSFTLGPFLVTCMHVTDPYQGNNAAATAAVSNGEVTAVTFSLADHGVNYADPAPAVSFTGGGGWGATATASVGHLTEISGVTVVAGGFGYTSAPTVNIGLSGPGLCGNVISFCAQTGDVGNNHSCMITYLPYLQALANSFA